MLRNCSVTLTCLQVVHFIFATIISALEDPDLIKHCGDAKALALGLPPSQNQISYTQSILPVTTATGTSYSSAYDVSQSLSDASITKAGIVYASPAVQSLPQGYTVTGGLSSFENSKSSQVGFSEASAYGSTGGDLVQLTALAKPAARVSYESPVYYHSSRFEESAEQSQNFGEAFYQVQSQRPLYQFPVAGGNYQVASSHGEASAQHIGSTQAAASVVLSPKLIVSSPVPIVSPPPVEASLPIVTSNTAVVSIPAAVKVVPPVPVAFSPPFVSPGQVASSVQVLPNSPLVSSYSTGLPLQVKAPISVTSSAGIPLSPTGYTPAYSLARQLEESNYVSSSRSGSSSASSSTFHGKFSTPITSAIRNVHAPAALSSQNSGSYQNSFGASSGHSDRFRHTNTLAQPSISTASGTVSGYYRAPGLLTKLPYSQQLGAGAGSSTSYVSTSSKTSDENFSGISSTRVSGATEHHKIDVKGGGYYVSFLSILC